MVVKGADPQSMTVTSGVNPGTAVTVVGRVVPRSTPHEPMEGCVPGSMTTSRTDEDDVAAAASAAERLSHGALHFPHAASPKELELDGEEGDGETNVTFALAPTLNGSTGPSDAAEATPAAEMETRRNATLWACTPTTARSYVTTLDVTPAAVAFERASTGTTTRAAVAVQFVGSQWSMANAAGGGGLGAATSFADAKDAAHTKRTADSFVAKAEASFTAYAHAGGRGGTSAAATGLAAAEGADGAQRAASESVEGVSPHLRAMPSAAWMAVAPPGM